jgi:hypothetical protein
MSMAAGLRFGSGAPEFPPPPFRRACALDADGICASVSWRAVHFSNSTSNAERKLATLFSRILWKNALKSVGVRNLNLYCKRFLFFRRYSLIRSK